MAKLSRKAVTVKAAVIGFITPRLAQDAKIDLTSVFEGVTAANYVSSKPAIALGVAKATAGKLAKDAKLEELDRVLLAFDAIEPAEEEEEKNMAEKGAQDRRKGRDAMPEAFLKHMEKKMSGDAFKGMCDAMADYEAEDESETEEERKEREKKEASDKKARDKAAKDAAEEDDKEKAMDAKIKTAVAGGVKAERDRQEAKQAALIAVRPFVGDLDAVAMDSAESVYRKALEMRGVKVDEVKEVVALKAILEAQPKPGARTTTHVDPSVAMDSSSIDAATKIAPGLSRIQIGA